MDGHEFDEGRWTGSIESRVTILEKRVNRMEDKLDRIEDAVSKLSGRIQYWFGALAIILIVLGTILRVGLH